MTVTHERIAEEYGKAITGERTGVVAQTGGARFAGYALAESDQLLQSATESSFGCGNPVAFSDVQPGQTVLDLGCGAGLDLLLAARKVGDTGKVIGVDMTDEMLSLARENVAKAGFAHVEVRKGRIEVLPVESQSVDWVISNCVINLSPEKQTVFNEIARVLKPGGKMLVSDIVTDKLPFWVRRSGLLTVACAGGAISEREYLEGLERAGFHEYRVIAREYYEAEQMASVALGAFPKWLAKRAWLNRLLIRLAQPITKNLWSARIYASVPA